MNLILHLPPETEALLKAQAEATGKAPEEFALSALQAHLGEATGRPKRRSRRSRKKVRRKNELQTFVGGRKATTMAS